MYVKLTRKEDEAEQQDAYAKRQPYYRLLFLSLKI